MAEDGVRFWSVLKMIFKLQFGTYCLRRIFPKYRDFSTSTLRKALDPSEPLSRLPECPMELMLVVFVFRDLKFPKDKRWALLPGGWEREPRT